MYDCKVKMAATLALCDDHFEAQLVAYAYFYLTTNKNFGWLKCEYDEENTNKAEINLIQKNDKDEIIAHFLRPYQNLKSHNSGQSSLII